MARMGGWKRVGLGLGVAVLATWPAVAAAEAMGVPDAPAPAWRQPGGPPAMGVPDAPAPVERMVARRGGVVLPDGLRPRGGRPLPGGAYEVALVECAGRFFVQLTHQVSRRGVRLPVHAAAIPAVEAGFRLRPGPRGGALELWAGGYAARLPLDGIVPSAG